MNALYGLALVALRAPLRALEGLGEVLVLLGEAIRWGLRRPFRPVVFVEAMEFVGVGSILIIALVGTFTGMVVGLQGVEAMRRVNAESFVGSGVAISLCRELSPVLTALMVTGRAASAMATEL